MILALVVGGLVLIALVGIVCLWAKRRVDEHVKRNQVAHLEGGRPR